MKNLVLTSSFVDFAPELKRLGITNGETPLNVGFIPTASYMETVNFYVERAHTWFKEQGMIVTIIDIAGLTQSGIEKRVADSDIIYVSGGNTFYLLQELRKNGADRAISQHVNQGKWYIGESAGSIVCSPYIGHIALMDNEAAATTLTSYEGLGFVDMHIVPHKGNEFFEADVLEIVEAYQDRYNLCVIDDQQAVVVCDDSLSIIRAGS